MNILYKIPSWFSGYDIALQIIFALTSLLVSIYAYKIYKFSKRREVKLFSIAFLLISISYLSWPIISLFLVFPLGKGTFVVLLENNTLADIIAIYFQIIFFLLGMTTLVYMTLKTKDKRIYVLLSLIMILTVIFAYKKTDLAYILSSLLIVFILFHYLKEYREKRNKKMLPVTIAFFFLLIGSLELVFSNDSHLYYVGGHVFMLIAYILILGRLIYLVKNGKKKRQA